MKKILLSAMLVFVLAFTGCTEKEEKKKDTNTEKTDESSKNEETPKKEIVIKDNKFCAVVDEELADKEVFTEYKGNKVYFCCNRCKGKFEKDPKKYTMK